jgi:hypothetical protein
MAMARNRMSEESTSQKICPESSAMRCVSPVSIWIHRNAWMEMTGSEAMMAPAGNSV